MILCEIGRPGIRTAPDFMSMWETLALTGHYADPVCCAPIWNLSYHAVFQPERRVFYLQGDEGLLLFSEYIAPTGEIYLTPLEDSWMFGRPLLGREALILLRQALAEFSQCGQMPAVVISGIDPGGLDATILLGAFHREYQFYRYSSSTQCSASLAGGFDAWLGRRSANHRAKLRKASRRASSMGMVFERHSPGNGEEAAAIYARMLAVESKSWKGMGHCGMTEAGSKEFYAELIDRQAGSKSARIIFARIDDEDIGFIYGGIAGSFYRGQQFSYADSYSKFSVGNLLQLEKIRWLCEMGIARYDMGPVTGPRMAYKKHWTEEFRNMEAWIMRKVL